jgi:hypothetical protein
MPKGARSGYVTDHTNPLECGRADARFHMQRQAIAEAKRRIDGCEIAAFDEPVATPIWATLAQAVDEQASSRVERQDSPSKLIDLNSAQLNQEEGRGANRCSFRR